MKAPLAFALFLTLLFSLAAQEYDQDEEFYDDDYYLFMEGGWLTIVGTRPTTQQMASVDRETIERTHAPDLPSLLQETLGLGVTRYGPHGNMASVNLRGFNTRRVAVLIDGIPVNSTASGDFDFFSVDPGSIERIEVIQGGSDTRYNVSGALGGVINIITVRHQEPGWRFGGGFSNTSFMPWLYNRPYGEGVGGPHWQSLADTQRVNFFMAYGAEHYSFRMNLFANRAANHFMFRDNYGYARRREGNEVVDAGTSLSFIRRLPDLSNFILTGSFYFADKNIPFSGFTAEHAQQNDLASRVSAMLEMPRAFNDDLSMELSLGHNWTELRYDPGRNASRHDEHRISLINRWAWYPTDESTLRFGGDYSFIRLDSTNAGRHYGHRSGLYLTFEHFPVRRLLLIASIKGTTDGNEIIPVPKFGLAWTVSDILTLRNNYFRSFKFPDLNDLHWVQEGFMGNPDLENEDGWGADLGAEITVNDWLTLNSVLYGQWIDNSIHWSNVTGIWRPDNMGTGFFCGWDNRLSLFLPFSSGSMERPTLSLSYAFQMSWLLSGDLTFADSIRIPYMPVHTFGVSLELPWITPNELPGSLVISGRFESSRYAETGNIIRLDPHFLLNIVFNQRLNNTVNLFGRIDNLLNTHYVSFADYPMPGVSLTIGMNMVFENWGRR